MSATVGNLAAWALQLPVMDDKHAVVNTTGHEWQDNAPSVFSVPLLAGSFLSIVCFLAQLASFCCVKSSRRHPATMIMYMGFSDLVFVVCVAVQVVARELNEHRLPFFMRGTISPTGDYEPGAGCRTLAFFAEFGILGGMIWFGLLGLDFLLTMRNPFYKHGIMLRYYAAIALFVASVAGAALAVPGIPTLEQIGGSSAGPGLSEFGFCWVLRVHARNVWMWVLFGIPLAAMTVLSIVIFLCARRTVRQSLRKTYEARRQVYVATGNYILAYTVFYTVALVLYLGADYLWPDQQHDDHFFVKDNVMAALLCFVFTARSVAMSVVWFYNNWPQIAPRRCAQCACARARAKRLQVTARGELDPLMNQMLQLELVDYSFKAMRASTASAHEMFDASYYEFAGQQATPPALARLRNTVCQRMLCGCCGLVSKRWSTHAAFTRESRSAAILKKLKAWKPPAGVSREANIDHLVAALRLPTAPGVASTAGATDGLSGQRSALSIQDERLRFATPQAEALLGAVSRASQSSLLPAESAAVPPAAAAQRRGSDGAHRSGGGSRAARRSRRRAVKATLWRDIRSRLDGPGDGPLTAYAPSSHGGGSGGRAHAEAQRRAKAAAQGRAPDGTLLPTPEPPGVTRSAFDLLREGGEGGVPFTAPDRERSTLSEAQVDSYGGSLAVGSAPVDVPIAAAMLADGSDPELEFGGSGGGVHSVQAPPAAQQQHPSRGIGMKGDSTRQGVLRSSSVGGFERSSGGAVSRRAAAARGGTHGTMSGMELTSSNSAEDMRGGDAADGGGGSGMSAVQRAAQQSEDRYTGAFSDSEEDEDEGGIGDVQDLLGPVGWVNLQPIQRNEDLLNFFFGASVAPEAGDPEEHGTGVEGGAAGAKGVKGGDADPQSPADPRSFVGRFNRIMSEMALGERADSLSSGGAGGLKSPLLPVAMQQQAEVVEPPPLEVAELAPAHFALMRTVCGIRPAEFLAEMKLNLDDFKSKARFSEGASNAFLCFSENNAFLLKTLTEGEVDTLRAMLPLYTKHICENPDTLLAKIFMCIRIKFYHQPFYLVAMSNCMHTPEDIHQRFDLKGSWVNRSANKSRGVQPSVRQAYEDDPTRLAGNVLLDNDLNFRLRMERGVAKELAKQSIEDAAMLRRAGIMDYSLLLGVHRTRLVVRSAADSADSGTIGSGGAASSTKPAGSDELTAYLPASSISSPDARGAGIRRASSLTADEVLAAHSPFRRGGFNVISPSAVEGPGRYYLGIIDILQEWNWNKRAERFLKTTFLCQPRHGLSAVPPEEYYQRFKKRIAEQVIYPPQDDTLQHLSVSAVRAEQQRRAAASAPKGPWQAVKSAAKQLLLLE